METNISSPHDVFFKNMMGRVEIARTYLRHYLPPEITSLMDMSTLEVDIEGYVDDALKTHFSDVVASVHLANGQPAEIYILFEHKSGLDKFARLQVLKYMVQKWFKWIKDREQFDGYLPIVIPVVVYHGIRKWCYSLDFMDLFRLPSEDFLRYVPRFEHILNDISHVDESTFRTSVDIQIFLMLLKYIFRPELNHKLPEIMSLLQELNDKDRITEYLPVIIRYILRAGNVTLDEIRGAVRSLPKGEETMETTADILIKEGIDRGLQQGIQIGESKGVQISIQELLLDRFDIFDPALAEKIRSIESTETLKSLFRKAMKTESLQEFTRIVDRVLVNRVVPQ